MKNKRSLNLPLIILVTLLALGGGSGLAFIWRMNSNPLQANTESNKDTNNTNPETNTEKSGQALKPTALGNGQQQPAVDATYSIPTPSQGKLISQAKLSPGKKVLALTFDDGPQVKTTAKILDILKQNNVNATFFVIGGNLQRFPYLAKRAVDEGNAIGNHTWHHWYRKLSPKEVAFEIDGTSDLIYKDTGVKTTLFRPPGGVLNNGVVTDVKSKKYAVIMWSADTEDYARPAAATILRRAEKEVKPGGILLMHDGGGDRSHTIAALPEVISYFKKQGYTFVTVPKLLDMQAEAENIITAKK